MKTNLFLTSLLMLLTAVVSSRAQTEMPTSRSVFVGMWKLSVAVSGPKAQPHPTYVQLLADSTFIWGIDSTAQDPMQGVTHGRWDIGSQAEIVFYQHTQYGDFNSYYEHQSGMLYMLRGHEESGRKVPEIRLETDTYLEKLP